MRSMKFAVDILFYFLHRSLHAPHSLHCTSQPRRLSPHSPSGCHHTAPAAVTSQTRRLTPHSPGGYHHTVPAAVTAQPRRLSPRSRHRLRSPAATMCWMGLSTACSRTRTRSLSPQDAPPWQRTAEPRSLSPQDAPQSPGCCRHRTPLHGSAPQSPGRCRHRTPLHGSTPLAVGRSSTTRDTAASTNR